jgi:hypothetical protein
VVYAAQPNVELRAADMAMDCFDPVFDASSENLCFVVDDTLTDRLQLATVPVPESDQRPNKGLSEVPTGDASAAGKVQVQPAPANTDRVPSLSSQPVKTKTVTSSELSARSGKAAPNRPFGSTLITSSKWDHFGPASYSSTGDLIYYSRDDSTNRTQAYVISAQGGDEIALTDFTDADVENVSFLDDEHVVFIYSEDGDYDRVAKFDVNTHELAILSDGDYDAETPDPAHDGSKVAFAALDGDGAYQVGLVDADGSNENLISFSSEDFETPDWSADGVSIAVSRAGTTIGIVEAGSGNFTPLTDSSETVLRESPDAYWSELGHQNLVVYTRENLSGSDGNRPRRPRRPGTGVFLVRHRRSLDGEMGASLGVLALERIEPNPASGKSKVTILWQIPAISKVSLRVFNPAGQLVKVLAQGEVKPGRYTTTWAGTDQKGRRLAAGIYFCALDAGDKRLTRKVVLAE